MEVRELKVLQDIDLSQNSIKNVSSLENSKGITLKKEDGAQITINDTTEIKAKTEVKLSSGDSNSISITPENINISADTLSIKSDNTEITEKKITTSEISSTTTSAGNLDATSITIKNEPNNVKIYWDSKTNSLVFEKA